MQLQQLEHLFSFTKLKFVNGATTTYDMLAYGVVKYLLPDVGHLVLLGCGVHLGHRKQQQLEAAGVDVEENFRELCLFFSLELLCLDVHHILEDFLRCSQQR